MELYEEVKGWLNLSEEELKRSESSVQQKQKKYWKRWALDSERQIVKYCAKFIYVAMQNTPGTKHHF